MDLDIFETFEICWIIYFLIILFKNGILINIW